MKNANFSTFVKALPADKVRAITDKFGFKTKQMDHQARSLFLSLDKSQWVFGLGMGLGKSKIGLDIVTSAKKIKAPYKTFITCPPFVINQWRSEIEKHSNLTSLLLIDGNWKDKLQQIKTTHAEVVVVSDHWLSGLFANTKTDLDQTYLIKGVFTDFSILIVDEAHRFKSESTKRFKSFDKFLAVIPRKYFLTGSIVGNDYTGIWAVYYLLDGGLTFGSDYYRFLHTYFNVIPTGRFNKYLLKDRLKKEFFAKFWSKIIRWDTEECLDLPSENHIKIPYNLTTSQRAEYDDALYSKNDKDSQAASIYYRLMKITSGIDFKESPKLDILKDLITQACINDGGQFIIWCWLKADHEYLKNALSTHFKKLSIESVNGSVSDKNKFDILTRWRAGKVKVLIANQKSLGIGIDLFEASVCCFFSNNLSYIDRTQSEKRIHRIGQKKPCFYYDLICNDTVDAFNYGVLKDASTNHAEVIDYFKILEDLRKMYK